MERTQIVGLALSIALVFALGSFLIIYTPESLGGDSRYFVMKNENPVVGKGSLFVTQDFGELESGDLVRYRSLVKNNVRIGRVEWIRDSSVSIEDEFVVDRDRVLGAVEFWVPYIGYLTYYSGVPFAAACVSAAIAAIFYGMRSEKERSGE
ncbi:MAG: hypothetical protein ACLFUR_01515 [Candidatus Hadarchaeia archaeon]